jgi:type 1 glutamine amidotransferase
MKHIVALAIVLTFCIGAEEPRAPKKIVLIAGKKSHGPGAHDYERTMRLFKAMLERSNVAARVRVEEYENGWPADPGTLETADTIVFYSDGRDGDKFSDVPFAQDERMALIAKQMQRGCGFMTMHFSTFVTKKQGETVLDWNGGFFDWEGPNGTRQWFSKISQGKTLELATPTHPIARGVAQSVPANDEIYWKLRFRENDPRWTPLWTVPHYVDESAKNANVVAWAVERADGGRGFGTSVGHAYRLWQDENIRKLFLNAIVWTAKAEVPAEGVQAPFLSDEDVQAALKK